MSSRPGILRLRDIEPIRAALGGGDESLLDLIRETYLRGERARHEAMLAEPAGEDDEADPGEFEVDEEELESIEELARSFVDGELEDGLEPGAWHQVIVLLAEGLGLAGAEPPINEGWARSAWRDYFSRVAADLADGPRTRLDHLVSGRPLKGEGLEPDGSYFGWLTPAEVAELIGALRGLGDARPDLLRDEFVGPFHADLIRGLAACEGGFLLIGA